MTVVRTPATGVPGPVLTPVAAEAWVPRTCFKHGPPERLGIELELVLAPAPGRRLPAPGAVRTALTALPVQGRVTVEPGGQIELSTHPAPDLPAALRTAQAGTAALRRRAAGHGARLLGLGLDPSPLPPRVLRLPRYDAMEAFFDRTGPAGRVMMRSTASVQVTVEAGPPGGGLAGVRRRWDLLHAVGPALVAAFANSPLAHGRPTGWCSTRFAVWLALDPYRTREPVIRPGESLPEAWTRWCLDAPVMVIRRPHGPWHAPAGLTFRRWIAAGRAAVPDRPAPTLDDLAYHLTTLFPPVRARGPLEIRYVDAQPGDWWQVPVAVLAGLTTDAAAAEIALDACAGVRGRWAAAARHGLRDPELALAARRVLDAAARGLRRHPATAPAAQAVEQYTEHWTLRGRCPADDVLDRREPPAAPAPAPFAPAAPREVRC
ncbi:MAG TPA: ergothioneine biosynthesis glutamate--cysteine ligase EgtA [Kineosporiaceae bacterium]